MRYDFSKLGRKLPFFGQKNLEILNFLKKIWCTIMMPWIYAKVHIITFLLNKLYGQEKENMIQLYIGVRKWGTRHNYPQEVLRPKNFLP